jgi:UDP-N-acetylmuramoylalanine--D-glutamate ligase
MRTRPAVSWSDLVSSTVGVWGLGVEGRANLRRLALLGGAAVLVDDRPPAGEVGDLPVLATERGGLEELKRCDVVIKSPGISRYRPEVEAIQETGTPVVGGLGLWMQEADRTRVACITGTKGKSTTTAIAGHLLGRLGYDYRIGGNLGAPPWDPEAGPAPDWWVVETSSFQATDLASSPALVAVTSLHADHLDWHGDVETYVVDKLSATSQPGAALTIADAGSALLRAHAPLLGGTVRWVRDERPDAPGWIDSLALPGAHNRRNALVAREVLFGLGIPEADDDGALARAASGFVGLGSRLRPIGSRGGVDFVDDSLSTNVLSALAALDTFAGRRVALLVGGHDRGIDYDELAAAVAGRPWPTLVLAMGPAGAAIAALIGQRGSFVEVVQRDDVTSATADAADWAAPDGVVLLSPAAPSFDQFRDYRHRAAAFADAVRLTGAKVAD